MKRLLDILLMNLDAVLLWDDAEEMRNVGLINKSGTSV